MHLLSTAFSVALLICMSTDKTVINGGVFQGESWLGSLRVCLLAVTYANAKRLSPLWVFTNIMDGIRSVRLVPQSSDPKSVAPLSLIRLWVSQADQHWPWWTAARVMVITLMVIVVMLTTMCVSIVYLPWGTYWDNIDTRFTYLCHWVEILPNMKNISLLLFTLILI